MARQRFMRFFSYLILLSFSFLFFRFFFSVQLKEVARNFFVFSFAKFLSFVHTSGLLFQADTSFGRTFSVLLERPDDRTLAVGASLYGEFAKHKHDFAAISPLFHA